MAMEFAELDNKTRQHMLDEFEKEQSGGIPYKPKALSKVGHTSFPRLVREAIQTGNEETLIRSLSDPTYWNPTETYIRDGVEYQRRVNVSQAAERLGLTEFNTWYVRGLAKRLIDEGVTQCQVYRGARPKWEPSECAAHEGRILPVETIYRGHRAKYWPEPGNPAAMSIPFGPGCHHTIRRVQDKQMMMYKDHLAACNAAVDRRSVLPKYNTEKRDTKYANST